MGSSFYSQYFYWHKDLTSQFAASISECRTNQMMYANNSTSHLPFSTISPDDFELIDVTHSSGVIENALHTRGIGNALIDDYLSTFHTKATRTYLRHLQHLLTIRLHDEEKAALEVDELMKEIREFVQDGGELVQSDDGSDECYYDSAVCAAVQSGCTVGAESAPRDPDLCEHAKKTLPVHAAIRGHVRPCGRLDDDIILHTAKMCRLFYEAGLTPQFFLDNRNYLSPYTQKYGDFYADFLAHVAQQTKVCNQLRRTSRVATDRQYLNVIGESVQGDTTEVEVEVYDGDEDDIDEEAAAEQELAAAISQLVNLIPINQPLPEYNLLTTTDHVYHPNSALTASDGAKPCLMFHKCQRWCNGDNGVAFTDYYDPSQHWCSEECRKRWEYMADHSVPNVWCDMCRRPFYTHSAHCHCSLTCAAKAFDESRVPVLGQSDDPINREIVTFSQAHLFAKIAEDDEEEEVQFEVVSHDAVPEVKDTIPSTTTLAPLEKGCPGDPADTASIMREYIIDNNIVWPTSAAQFSMIDKWVFPGDYLQSTLAPYGVSSFHTLLRSDFEITLRLNNSPFATGALMLVWTTNTPANPAFNSPATWMNSPHTIIKAGAEDMVTLKLPWSSIQPYVTMPNPTNIGLLTLYVWVPLVTGTGQPTAIAGTLWAKAVSPLITLKTSVVQGDDEETVQTDHESLTNSISPNITATDVPVNQFLQQVKLPSAALTKTTFDHVDAIERPVALTSCRRRTDLIQSNLDQLDEGVQGDSKPTREEPQELPKSVLHRMDKAAFEEYQRVNRRGGRRLRKIEYRSVEDESVQGMQDIFAVFTKEKELLMQRPTIARDLATIASAGAAFVALVGKAKENIHTKVQQQGDFFQVLIEHVLPLITGVYTLVHGGTAMKVVAAIQVAECAREFAARRSQQPDDGLEELKQFTEEDADAYAELAEQCVEAADSICEQNAEMEECVPLHKVTFLKGGFVPRHGVWWAPMPMHNISQELKYRPKDLEGDDTEVRLRFKQVQRFIAQIREAELLKFQARHRCVVPRDWVCDSYVTNMEEMREKQSTYVHNDY